MSIYSLISCLALASADSPAAEASVPGTSANLTATAQELGPLVSDRPDVTESAETIPPGRLQLEGGYTFTHDREGRDRIREHASPELLFRWGLVENLELRFGWDGYLWSDESEIGETRSGRSARFENTLADAADITLGAKAVFTEGDAWLPRLAGLFTVSVPSGGGGSTSGDVDPEFKLLWSREMTDAIGIAGNLGIASVTEDGRRFAQGSASLSMAFAIDDRLGLYFEYFGLYPDEKESDASHSANGGLTYRVTDDFQIDARVGAGLNEQADDFFVGVGFAWRF